MRKIILLVIVVGGLGLSGCATSANNLDVAASRGLEAGVATGVASGVGASIAGNITKLLLFL